MWWISMGYYDITIDVVDIDGVLRHYHRCGGYGYDITIDVVDMVTTLPSIGGYRWGITTLPSMWWIWLRHYHRCGGYGYDITIDWWISMGYYDITIDVVDMVTTLPSMWWISMGYYDITIDVVDIVNMINIV
jgi:hypothetical protein